MTEHYAEHFNPLGYCQCDCDSCHLRLIRSCICPDCVCDDPNSGHHMVESDRVINRQAF